MEMEFGDIERGTITLTKIEVTPEEQGEIGEAFLIEIDAIENPELAGAALSRAEVERLIERLQELLK